MNEKLTKILEEAKNDDEFRKELIKTREQRDVMDSFCKVVTSRGYDMTVGELFSMGEEYTSNLLKSVNGGAKISYWRLEWLVRGFFYNVVEYIE